VIAKVKRKPFVVAIAGASGSGKTTFAHRMVAECGNIGIDGQIFSLDNYYRPLNHLSFEDRQNYNFDHPNALDLHLAFEDLESLCQGKSVQKPDYDFKLHTRKKKPVTAHPTRLIVVEGIYALYPKDFHRLYDYKIFTSTRIATAILRRVQRDVEQRGRTIENAKHQILTTVLPMYETYVKPTQREAHFSIEWDGEEVPVKATEGLLRMVRDYFRKDGISGS